MGGTRRFGMVALVVAIVGGLAYGFAPRAVPVDVAHVERGPLRVTVDEEGKTRVINRFVLSAPVAAVARRIEYDVGDPVTAGQVLVQLEPLRSTVLDPRSRAEAAARLSAAEAALRAAKESARAATADADLAQVDQTRVARLHAAGDISQGALDEANAAARRTQAAQRSAAFAVDVARFEVEAARTALRFSAGDDPAGAGETVAIRAPVAGCVLRIRDKSERVVAPGEPLVEIGDARALEVEVDVLSADAVRMQPGTPVLFDRWGGNPPLEGSVRVVEPVGFTKVSALGVEEQRVWVIADILSPPERWARLGDGYRVEARFVLWEGADVLQVPASALFRRGEGWAVFVVEDGRARRRPVEVGHRSGLSAEITAGLALDDMVIPHPDDAIEDGTRVAIRRPETTSP